MKLNSLVTPILLVFLCGFFSAQQNYNSLVYGGNKKFDKNNYDGASSNYMEAIKKNDKDFTAHYNLGNALYKKKMYREADAEYQKAENLAKNKADKAAAIYNRGNVQMQGKEHEKAAELYKKSLKIDPYNEAVRKNYEIAKLKDQQDKNKQGQGKGNPENGNGKDQNQGQNQENKDGKSPQQAGNGSQNSQGKGQGNEQQQNNTGDNSENLPDDVKKAILNRTGNKERETAKRILNKNAYSYPQSNDKDW